MHETLNQLQKAANSQSLDRDFAQWQREVSSFFAEVKCELAMLVAANDQTPAGDLSSPNDAAKTKS